MAYFNVTTVPENAVDGIDIADTKSIDMVPWQNKLVMGLQKADAKAAPSIDQSSGSIDHHDTVASFASTDKENVAIVETGAITIPQDSGTKTSGKTFSPETALAQVGESVIWTNKDTVPHTVDSRDGSISSGYLMKDQSFQYSFSEPGTHEYYCTLHPWMTGSIKVADANSAS